MRSKRKQEPESIVREIKRKTRRKFTSEEKIRIVLEGLQANQALQTYAAEKRFTQAYNRPS